MKTSDDFLDDLNDADLAEILRQLVRDDPDVAVKVKSVVKERIESPVDVEGIADSVFMNLEFIDVEDLWDQSGSHRDGYHDPVDEAYEMAEGAIGEYLEEMEKFVKRSKPKQALCCCMGIVHGLHQFDTEAKTEFRDWAEDVSESLAGDAIRQWRKSKPSASEEKRLKKFLAEKCPKFNV